MSPEQETVPVKIGTISLNVPVHRNREVTVEIARRVGKKFSRIEEESGKMNTLNFTVQTAYEFAAELYDLEEQYSEETREFNKALESIASQLKTLEKRYHLVSRHKKKDDEEPLEG
ncbi:MAG TPA: cell division protein ZapA [Candidatus Hydrogenedentes bacterium]|nr:cell division protein ZapA [Candidatus Hydrogenedentota bacterium]